MSKKKKRIAAKPKSQLNLQSFDVVSMVGVKDNNFHKVIRTVSAGIGGINDLNIPVHTGMVVPIDGENVIVEMKALGKRKGLVINPIEKDKSFISGVTRFKLNSKEKKAILKSIKKDLKTGVNYSKKPTDVMRFLFKNSDKKTLKTAICSEYTARKIEENSRYDIARAWHKVKPVDLINTDIVKFSKGNKKKIRGSKVEYIKRKDLIKSAFQKIGFDL